MPEGNCLSARGLYSYLQPHGSRGPRKASWTFITFLPEKALLASRPWLAVSPLQGNTESWVRTGSRYHCLRAQGPSECP